MKRTRKRILGWGLVGIGLGMFFVARLIYYAVYPPEIIQASTFVDIAGCILALIGGVILISLRNRGGRSTG